MSDLIKLGGLWVNKDRNGKSYLSGRLSSNVRILVFKNEYRSAENQPAYVMYLSQIEQQDENARTAPQDEFLSDDFETPTDMNEPAAPTPQNPPARRLSPAPTRQAPAMNTPAPAAQGARPRATGQMNAASRPAARPAPSPAQDDFEDLEDPFSE